MDIAAIIHTPAGAGEIVGDSPDRRVEILSDHKALNATWSRFGPRRDGADLHVHHRHHDLFYVIEGELTIRLGPDDEQVAIAAGTLIRVPPLVIHGFRNASDADVRYLNLHAPGRGFAGFLRDLRDGGEARYDQHEPPDDGGRDPAEAQIGGSEPAPAPVGASARLLTEVDEVRVTEVEAAARTAWLAADGDTVISLYVFTGDVLVACGGEAVAAKPGSWLQTTSEPGMSVTTRTDARFLEVRTPAVSGP